MQEISVKYQIGKSSVTKEFSINNQIPIQKQLHLSLPLITGATIHLPIEKNIKIIIGKEINLDQINLEKYKIEKYDIDISELADLALKGYRKACLLNYKKYDSVVVGVKDDDMIVSDFLSLKRIIDSLGNT